MVRLATTVVLTGVLALSMHLVAQTPVPAERLLGAEKEPQNWMMYGADYSSHRYSSLTQITGRLRQPNHALSPLQMKLTFIFICSRVRAGPCP